MTMQINELIMYFLYNVLVTFFLVFAFFNCLYKDFELITYYISFYLFGNYVLFTIFKHNQIVTLQNSFNVFGFLYSNFLITQMIFNHEKINSNYYLAMNLSYLSIIVFNIFFVLTNKNIQCKAINNYFYFSKKNLNNLIIIIISALVICLMIEYYVVFYKIGIINYALASRASKSLLMRPYVWLTFYKTLTPLISVISLLLYVKYKKKAFKTIFFAAFFITLFNSLISMSRSELISLLLPIFYLLEKNKAISKKILVILIVSVFFLFGIWKSLKSSQIEIHYDGELNTWYKIFDNVSSLSNQKLWGKSYLDTAINLVIPFTGIEPLSKWYIRKFEYEVYLRGGGRGFSSVLEAFMNYGVLGIVFVYGFYGFLFKQIELKVKKENDLFEIIYMIFMVSLFQFFRSESYSLWKNMVWFRVYPVIFLFISAKGIKFLHLLIKAPHVTCNSTATPLRITVLDS